MVYDAIIVGAGIGGIVAGLNLAKNDKKVLILEKNSLPGGLVSTFKKGRFEFDTSLYHLYNYGDDLYTGDFKKLLSEFQIDIDSLVTPINARIKALDENLDYVINGQVEDWFLSLEKLTPKSMDSLSKLLPILKEIHNALELLINGCDVSEAEYPHFYEFLNYNAIDGLVQLKIPKNTIHNLGYIWIHIGSPLNKLSFIDFSEFLYKIIFKKNAVLTEKNLNFILKLIKRYEDLGGTIFYRSEVSEIDIRNEEKIVTLKNGEAYKCRDVICNLSNHYIYKNLIKDDYPKMNQLNHARTLSCSSLVVYLGLNKSHEDLNLNQYEYYEFQSINSEKNIKTMNKFYHKTLEGYVPNVVNHNASPKNTTILILKTDYYGDIFNINNNYYYQKEELARNLIQEFETAFGVDITEYIEEIEIASPLTFLNYTNNPNGCINGYMRLGYDNSIHRLISYQDEAVPGIHIVGGSSLFASGVDNAFLSGYYVAKNILGGESNE